MINDVRKACDIPFNFIRTKMAKHHHTQLIWKQGL